MKVLEIVIYVWERPSAVVTSAINMFIGSYSSLYLSSSLFLLVGVVCGRGEGGVRGVGGLRK